MPREKCIKFIQFIICTIFIQLYKLYNFYTTLKAVQFLYSYLVSSLQAVQFLYSTPLETLMVIGFIKYLHSLFILAIVFPSQGNNAMTI